MGSFRPLKLEKHLSLYELGLLSLSSPEADWTPDDDPKETLANNLVSILCQQSEVLKNHFSIGIENQCITSIPILLQGYIPPLACLPMFVLRLATNVEWDDESLCIYEICNQLGRFYRVRDPQYYFLGM